MQRISDIIVDIENTFIEFQDTLIHTKAAICVLRANKASLYHYSHLLDEIKKCEEKIDFQVAKVMENVSGTQKETESYKTYATMKRDMDLISDDVDTIHNHIKETIYSIFRDNLMETLNNSLSTDSEEYKYDPYLSPVHPIFDKKLTVYTMVCQDEGKIKEINTEITRKLAIIEELENVSPQSLTFSDQKCLDFNGILIYNLYQSYSRLSNTNITHIYISTLYLYHALTISHLSNNK